MRITLNASIAVIAIFLSACGGGGGGGSGGTQTPLPMNLMAGGIWHGSLTNNGQTVALVALLSNNGGRIVEGTDLSAGVTTPTIINPGDLQGTDGQYQTAMLGGTNVATETHSGQASESLVRLAATIDPLTSITGTIIEVDSSTSSFALSYDATDYQQPSSFALIAGTYTCPTGPNQCGSATFDVSGNLAGTYPQFGVSYVGNVSIVDPAYNLYAVQFTGMYGSAIGPHAPFPTQHLAGYATFTPATGGQPAQLTMVVNADSSSVSGTPLNGYYWVMTKQ